MKDCAKNIYIRNNRVKLVTKICDVIMQVEAACWKMSVQTYMDHF